MVHIITAKRCPAKRSQNGRQFRRWPNILAPKTQSRKKQFQWRVMKTLEGLRTYLGDGRSGAVAWGQHGETMVNTATLRAKIQFQGFNRFVETYSFQYWEVLMVHHLWYLNWPILGQQQQQQQQWPQPQQQQQQRDLWSTVLEDSKFLLVLGRQPSPCPLNRSTI